MNRRLTPGLLLAMLTLGSRAAPQEPAERKEGDLQTFIDRDSKELGTRLEALQHSLYSVEQQLVATSFRQQFGSEVRMEEVMFPNVDHDLTPGYVFTPVALDRAQKHPGLVMVHGGYHWSLHKEFFGYIVRAVREGYIVIFPEYRGSRGYGAEHYKAQEYGGRDVDDVLWAADYLALRPYVDGDRLGIVGRSRGGMLTLLAIERSPKRFRAAAHIVGLVDFLAYMAYKPDYRRHDVAREPHFGGLPFENLGAYIESSPINFVEKIEAPLLVLATTHDRTVPYQVHTQRLIEVLKAYGKKFEYKLYERAPGGHSFAWGDSEAGRDAQDRLFSFLQQELKP